MRLLQQCFRVYCSLEGFDASILFYERLQGTACERRVDVPETNVQAAKVGGVLILAGSDADLDDVRHVAAIFYVDNLDAAGAWLAANGATVLDAPRDITAGRNLTARHSDGLVAEYFEAR